VQCGGTSSCQGMTSSGSNGPASFECIGVSSCQGGTLSCGDGHCEATCGGTSAQLSVAPSGSCQVDSTCQ
jgi:hypothetical protein